MNLSGLKNSLEYIKAILNLTDDGYLVGGL